MAKKLEDILRLVRKFSRALSNGIRYLWEGDVLPLIDKMMRNSDGTYRPYLFLDFPIGLSKTRSFLFISCPQITREVLHQSASPDSPNSSFDFGWIGDLLKRGLGDIMFVAPFEKHTLLRQSITQYFRQNVDKRFGTNLIARSNALIDDWLHCAGKKINATHELHLFASLNVIDNFIGEVTDPLRLHRAMNTLVQNMERELKMKRPFSKEKLDEARKVVEEAAIEACRKCQGGTSLLKAMHEMKDENGRPVFVKDDIESMARFLFFAGQDTVGSLLPLLFHHCKEEFQDHVREEWQEIGGDPNSEEDIMQFSKKSKWVQAILSESLRLFPPAYAASRVAKQDTQVQEIFIPKGTTLSLFLILAQKDTRYWGENAAQFVPQRWFTIYQEGKNFPFLPFGIGPHNCLGQPFARLEIAIALTVACLRMKWRAHGAFELATKMTLSSKKDVMLSAEPIASMPSSLKKMEPCGAQTPLGQCPFSSHIRKP